MYSKILTFFLAFCAGVLWAAPPEATLDLAFKSAQKAGDTSGKIDIPAGNSEGWLAVGKKGYLIPVKGLCGTSGTLLVKLRQDVPTAPERTNRIWFTLCTNSRLTTGVFFIPSNGEFFTYQFGDIEHQLYERVPKGGLKFGTPYWLGITWDGSKVRFYLDGKLYSEHKQPMAMDKVSYLALGPYNDKWRSPVPWGDDTFFYSVKLFDRALAPEDVAELCGVKPPTAAEQFPALLTVNSAAKGKPVIDGKADEVFWKQATGLPQLIDIGKPELSFRPPEGGFRMAADSENLYLCFRYLIPANNTVNAGQQRTAGIEPEVWGSESFELYLAYQGNVFRFAGNAAGGFLEAKNGDSAFNAPWTYQTTLAMQIDNTHLWQGEVAIPWQSLGLAKAPEEGLSMNFARTWCLSDCTAATSLTGTRSYGMANAFIPVRFAVDASAAAREKRLDPSQGLFHEELSIFSPRKTKISCEVALVKANGMAAPLVLAEKTVDTVPGEALPVTLDAHIETTTYDALRWSVSENSKILARQIVPLSISENFLDVAPRFLNGRLDVHTQLAMLKGKFGADRRFAAVLLNPEGNELVRQPVTDNNISLPFSPDLPAGTYQIQLRSGEEVISSCSVDYPGPGEWANAQFPNDVILPPFIPMNCEGTRVSMWGRTYDYTDSLLPRSLKTQDTELFSKPAVLVIGNEEITQALITPGIAEKHRTEYTATASGTGCFISEKSWIEYDGVCYNTLTVKAQNDLKNIRLRFTLPAAMAKYIHANYGGSWGTKITRTIAEGHTDYANYPVLWLGMEDKGLCLFFEHTEGWTESRNAQWSIDKDSRQAVLELHLKDALKAGDTFQFAFGYVATPVKPHLANFPLNNYGDEHTVLMRRADHLPVNSLFGIAAWPRETESFFGDLPDKEHSLAVPVYQKLLARGQQANIPSLVYMDAAMLQSEYPEVAAFHDEWRAVPGVSLPYTLDGKKYETFRCCPRTGASAFFHLKMRDLLKRFPFQGVYYDFGVIGICNNPLHGCQNFYPLLAMREFYRRTALVLLQSGVKQPEILLHNTDCVQVPVVTFATRLFNGEHIRQHSSTIMHNGKDILDTYSIEMFASELSSLPFGLTNSVYQSTDVLLPEFGGGKEDPELYKFRITQAFLAGVLPHNTIVAQNRCHYGILDKVTRIYESFGVPNAKFIGYWNKPAVVKGAKDIYVSCYVKDGKVLAVVSHIGKEHISQNFEITFDWEKLGVKPLTKAVDRLNVPDPDYDKLYDIRRKNEVPDHRAPLKLGDFGSKVEEIDGNTLKMELKFHTFALIELTN